MDPRPYSRLGYCWLHSQRRTACLPPRGGQAAGDVFLHGLHEFFRSGHLAVQVGYANDPLLAVCPSIFVGVWKSWGPTPPVACGRNPCAISRNLWVFTSVLLADSESAQRCPFG